MYKAEIQAHNLNAIETEPKIVSVVTSCYPGDFAEQIEQSVVRVFARLQRGESISINLSWKPDA